MKLLRDTVHKMKKQTIYKTIAAVSLLLLTSGCATNRDNASDSQQVESKIQNISEPQVNDAKDIEKEETVAEEQNSSQDEMKADSQLPEGLTYTVPEGYIGISFSENKNGINTVFMENGMEDSDVHFNEVNVWDNPGFIMEADASTLQYNLESGKYEYAWSGSYRLQNEEGKLLTIGNTEVYLTEGTYQLFTDEEREELVKKGGYLVSEEFGKRHFYCAYLCWTGNDKRILVGMNKDYFSKEDCVAFLNTVQLPESETGIPVIQAEEWSLDVSYIIPEDHKAISSYDAEGSETIILVPKEAEYPENLNALDCGIYSSTVVMKALPIELCVFEEGILKNANTNINAVEVLSYEELLLGDNSILFGEASALTIDQSYYNELEEHGISLSEEELYQEHWCAFFGQENGERAVMVLLSKDYFQKEEAMQWLQQMDVTDKTFSR